ncbi:Aristolochene synthase [Colletotrichum sp. SAR11_59]|nr:Aristolochene synthase [Colletotrichum sp. SAR11_59]
MATLSIKEENIPLQSGRKAIITGGASGIGLATAKVLAAKGADVVILDISEPEETLLSTIRFRKCDISQWSDLRDAFADVGVIHIAVANAGQSEDGTYLTDSFDAQGNLLEPNYDVIDVNLRGTLNFVKLALHNMRSNQTKGSIVLTSSATAYLAEQSLPVYSGTKAAVRTVLSEALKKSH